MPASFVILFALLLVFGIYLGFQVGLSVGARLITRADYWKANIAVLIVGAVLVALLAVIPLMWGALIGLLVGALTGLKMAFGESVGPWKKADEFFNINKTHRERAESGQGVAVRQRRRSGEDAPELISTVTTPTEAASMSDLHKQETR